MATLKEINCHWSYSDLLKGNAVLDMVNSINEQNRKESERHGKRN